MLYSDRVSVVLDPNAYARSFDLLTRGIEKAGSHFAFHGGVIFYTVSAQGETMLSTILSFASKREPERVEEVVRRLVADGVGINEKYDARDRAGKPTRATFFIDALEHGTPAYLAFLLSLGADPSIARETTIKYFPSGASRQVEEVVKMTTADQLKQMENSPWQESVERAAVLRSFFARRTAERLLQTAPAP